MRKSVIEVVRGDVVDYGIHSAVQDAGFLCERADMAIFSGDILQWIKERI